MSATRIEPARIAIHLTLALGGSLLVLAGLFYAAGNAGNDISPARLMEVIKSGSIGLFALYALTMLLGLLLRAWRYQVLLRASGDPDIPGYKDMTLITAVRNMTVDLLPARLGELVFVALLRKKVGTRVSSGLSALLFATLLDIVVLAPFTIAIGLMVGFPNKQPYLLALIALFIVAGFLFGLKYILPYFNRLIRHLAARPGRITGGFFRFVLSVDEALDATMKAGIFTRVISLTVLIRLFKYSGMLLLFYGLTRVNFPSLDVINEFKVLAALIASEMTAAMPVPALMSFGTWELGGMTLLAFFGAPPQQALITLLGVHVQTQAMDYGIGIAALLALLLLGKTGVSAEQGRKVRLIAGVVFVLLAALVAGFAIKASRGVVEQPRGVISQVVRPDSDPLPAWTAELDGFIVWSSNRSGNHDIWIMSLPDMQIRPLTNNPNTENFARISPDGKKVVFARAHKVWQSLRDQKPWDIWMVDVASGEQELIAKWGMSPAWSPDGSEITFQREPGMMMAVDLQTREERIVYQSGQDSFMSVRAELQTPEIGPDGRLSFTYRDGGVPTNVVRDENGKFIEVYRDACQVLWAPSGDYVTYVQKGGRQVNRIIRFDPASGESSLLLDLPGEFSHEYFPRLSANEKYLMFAASDGGQEHDLANYELFLWPLGAAPEAAARLTFNKTNDSWPDIWLIE